MRKDRTHIARGGLITLIKNIDKLINITFTATDIPSTINTHTIELQKVKVHITNTKQITIANICIPPRDTTPKHHKKLTRTYNTAFNTSLLLQTQSHRQNTHTHTHTQTHTMENHSGYTKQFTNTAKHASHKTNRSIDRCCCCSPSICEHLKLV